MKDKYTPYDKTNSTAMSAGFNARLGAFTVSGQDINLNFSPAADFSEISLKQAATPLNQLKKISLFYWYVIPLFLFLSFFWSIKLFRKLRHRRDIVRSHSSNKLLHPLHPFWSKEAAIQVCQFNQDTLRIVEYRLLYTEHELMQPLIFGKFDMSAIPKNYLFEQYKLSGLQ